MTKNEIKLVMEWCLPLNTPQNKVDELVKIFVNEHKEAINFTDSCQKLNEGHKNSFKYWLEENNYKKVYDKYVKYGFEYSESELIAKYNEELMNL